MHHVPDDIKNTIGKALGRIPSGVFILTAEHDGQASAMLASWVQQVAFDPPTIMISIGQDRPIAQLIKESNRLAISIIPENDTTLMKRYARGLKPGEDPFANIATLTTPSGLRVFPDAVAWLDCDLIKTCTFNGDHEIHIAKVTAGALIKEGPSFTHQRGSGFHY
jgi:3-hydroxy-9,10-secoandrosta-1,3,5(10)-triene-9,17-dione monooxygenase reductase component